MKQLFASGFLVRNRDPLDILVPENGTHRHSRSVSSSCLNTAQNCLWGLFVVPTRQENTPTRNLASSRCPHILSSHTGQWLRYSSWHEGLQRPAKTVVAKKRKNLATIKNHPSALWGYFEDVLIRRVCVFDLRSASLGNQALRARALFCPSLTHCAAGP